MDASQIVTLVIAIVGSGSITGLGVALVQRSKIKAEARKTGVDAAQVLSEASVALLIPMKDQISMMNDQLTRATQRADLLDERLRAVTAELETLRGTARELHFQLDLYKRRYGPITANEGA